jgi:hypothetical protein
MSLTAALAAAALATAPPPASAPGLVVAHAGKIYVEGRAVARGAEPAWSPDGRRIAFTRAGEIYVVDADGRNARRLTTMAQPGAFPAWSPDGRTIAFARTRDVFSVPSRGGPVRRLTRSPKPWLMRTTPAYSPNGRTIAITATTDAYNSDVFLMRPDGSNLRRLTRSQGTHDRLGEEHAPDFSPDGRRIVFVSNRDGNAELYSIGVDGRDERRLTRTPRVDEEAPRYSSDGTRILFTDDGRIAHMRAAGGDVRRLGSGTSADWRPPVRSLLEDGRPVPTALLRPVPPGVFGSSGVYGSASFGPYRGGTLTALVVHNLRPGGFARARLHAGTSLRRLSASFTLLPELHANRRGTARVQGRVLFRGIEDVAFADIADGRHSVVIVVRGRIVAFGVVPRDR